MDEVLLSMSKNPSDDILESLFKLGIRESAQLKTVLELYNMEIHQKISMPNYQTLKTMVNRSIDQKLRLTHFDARNEIIEARAVVTRRMGLSGIGRGEGVCSQWRAKGQCSRGDRCSFWHDGHERAKPTPRARGTHVHTQFGGSHNCTPFLVAESVHVMLSIANDCLCLDPYARC